MVGACLESVESPQGWSPCAPEAGGGGTLLGLLLAAGGGAVGAGTGRGGAPVDPGAFDSLLVGAREVGSARDCATDGPPLGAPESPLGLSCCSDSGAPNVRVEGMNVGADVLARNSSARCTSANASRALTSASEA